MLFRSRRSQAWFGRQDRDGFIYRSWMKNRGIPHDQFDGRPVIGICNTYSELTPCNSHFRTLAEQAKIGVWEAGGFPLEFPDTRSEEHTSELQSLMRISYAVFCLNKTQTN